MLQETFSRTNISLAESTATDRSRASVPAVGMLSALSSFELAERLVQVWIRSDQHLKTLEALNDKLTLARRYLSSANPHRALGLAYLERLRDKRSRCLAHLRSERRTALALMKENDSRAAFSRRRAFGA